VQLVNKNKAESSKEASSQQPAASNQQQPKQFNHKKFLQSASLQVIIYKKLHS